jgi:hypothetical protein
MMENRVYLCVSSERFYSESDKIWYWKLTPKFVGVLKFLFRVCGKSPIYRKPKSNKMHFSKTSQNDRK